jgi:hypothetical protein
MHYVVWPSGVRLCLNFAANSPIRNHDARIESGDEFFGVAESMLASILIGGAALLAVSLSAALFLFAHLTGRIRRSTALSVAAAAVAGGAALAGSSLLGHLVYGRSMVPIGVALMLTAGINGFLAYQAKAL